MNTPVRVLLVEDVEDDAILMMRALQRSGYVPEFERVDTPEAMKAALAKQSWDIVISDYAMPHFDALKALKLSKETGLDLPFIIVSGTIGEDVAVAAMRSGAHDYVMKDKLARLGPAVQRELQEARVRRARRQAEASLQKSETRFREMAELLPDIVYEMDKELNLTYVNQAAFKAFGYSEEEIAEGIRVAQVMEEGEVEQFMETLAALAQGEVPRPRIYIAKRKDGSTFPCETTSAPMRDAAGEIIGFRGVMRDITERQQAEEALREKEAQLRQIIDLVPHMIFAKNRAGRFILVNRAVAEAYGTTVANLTGSMHADYHTSAEELRRFLEEDIEVIESGRPKIIPEETFLDKDEQVRVLQTTRIPFTVSGLAEPAVLGVSVDITERKRAEEEREKMQEQLHQAQKMEAIGILAGGVAHDFNNLLTTIQGFVDLAMIRVAETGPIYTDLQQVMFAAQRAAALTRQLLLFSSKQPMALTLLNINRTVDNLLRMLRRLIGEDIAIKTGLEPDVWTIRADAGKIEQVIMNLAVNARDAMPNGGSLTIKTANVILDKESSKFILDAQPGKFVRLSVIDTGVGITKEVMPFIFDPFFTTKKFGRGTGLGLSVVFGIVKQHKGWINVYSEPGQGTTFKVYIPAVEQKLEDVIEKIFPLEQFRGEGERILLVEDDKAVREFTARALGTNGYSVFEVENSRQALELFEKEQGKFDLIFCDVVLPDQSGLRLVEQILSIKPEVHVLLSSGYTDHKSRWSLIRERDFKFLQKPYTLPNLLRVVREVIEGN